MNIDPTPATGTEAAVCADIARRQKLGVSKYGKTVADNPLTLPQWIKHAYEEALDLAVYLRRAMDEMQPHPVIPWVPATGTPPWIDTRPPVEQREELLKLKAEAYREDNTRLVKEVERLRVMIREQTMKSKETIEELEKQLKGADKPETERVSVKESPIGWDVYFDGVLIETVCSVERRDKLVAALKLSS